MKSIFILLSALCLSTGVMAQKEVGGVMLPASVTFNNEELVLNGAGVREKFWINLYAAGLYLDEKTSDAEVVLASEKPMALKLHIVSKLITSDKMIEAVTEGFENATGGNTAPIQDEIDQILSFFKEDIKKNDIFDLVYLPSEGIVAYKNGVKKGTVKGEAFKKAMFGIWLSNRPADDSLKDDLLGE